MPAKNSIRVRIVPWYNIAHFKKVLEYLYSTELTKKKWAYDTIAVWDTKCHPSLPVAIEATYVLTSAVIQDILWSNKTSLVHYTDLQGIYGSAIMRFVSLTVEVNKRKDVPTYSVAEVAKSISIPSFIVDMRNEWSHSNRPSLSHLRFAANSALEFLKKSYWEKEADNFCNSVKQLLDETGLYNLFKEFIQFHNDTLSSKKEKVIQSDDGMMRVNPEYVKILRKLEKYLKRHKRLFIKVLVYDGIFIPDDEDFKGMVRKEEYALFNEEYYLDDGDEKNDEMDVDYDYEIEFERKNLPEIPEYHENLWEQVIALLNKYDAVPLFMESLLESQGDRTIVGQKLLISWIMNILRHHSEYGFSEKARCLKKVFRRKGFVVNWFRLLHSAVANPCKYTLIVVPLILANLDLKKEVAIRIMSMISLKLGLVDLKEQRGKFCKLFHTVDDLKKALEEQRNNGKEQSAENIWSPCPDDCNTFWPISKIVNIIQEKGDDEEEKTGATSEGFPGLPDCTEMPSNKNEDDDDDDDELTYMSIKHHEGPDMKKIRMEVERRDSLLYNKRSV